MGGNGAPIFPGYAWPAERAGGRGRRLPLPLKRKQSSSNTWSPATHISCRNIQKNENGAKAALPVRSTPVPSTSSTGDPGSSSYRHHLIWTVQMCTTTEIKENMIGLWFCPTEHFMQVTPLAYRPLQYQYCGFYNDMPNKHAKELSVIDGDYPYVFGRMVDM